MQHVVIRREEYVAGSTERPEVGVFTQTHKTRRPIPWGRVAPGDTVWMKWSGGPVIARAQVREIRELGWCIPEELRETTRGYALYHLGAYWDSLPEHFYGLAVFLEDEEWLDDVFEPDARSGGGGWIVLDSPERETAWLTPAPQAEPADRPPGRGPRTVGKKLRFTILRRDGFRCRYCGRRPPDVVLHVDHAVSWAEGGMTQPDNLVTACKDCNLGKGRGSVESI